MGLETGDSLGAQEPARLRFTATSSNETLPGTKQTGTWGCPPNPTRAFPELRWESPQPCAQGGFLPSIVKNHKSISQSYFHWASKTLADACFSQTHNFIAREPGAKTCSQKLQGHPTTSWGHCTFHDLALLQGAWHLLTCDTICMKSEGRMHVTAE